MAEPAPAAVDVPPEPMPEAAPADAALPPQPPGGAHAAAQEAAAAVREVFQTTKKKDAVIVNGFVMIKHYVSDMGTVQHWRCEQVNKLRCNARGQSAAGSTDVVMRPKHTDHNHEADTTAIKVRKIQNEVKEQAKRHQMTSAAVIVDDALRAAPEDVVLAVPRENLLRIVSNARRLDVARQINRGNVADIVFPDEFKTTAIGDQFLLVDSRTLEPAPPSVFFIFASPTQLRELRRWQHWAVDGTFYCTPHHFDSVFTLHVHVQHSSVPVAYFLLQDRTEDTYSRALAAFVAAADIGFVQPASIMSDFEVAAINALRATFPMSAIRLCLFHLAQATFRNIADLGLVRLYRDNARAQEILRCFPALAAVPPEDVVEGLNAIVDELHRMIAVREIDADWEAPIAAFEDYFERTYIRKLNRLGNGFVDPRYPVASWNHYNAILGNLHRTNNAVEGWHHAFNNTFSSPHMSLDKFIHRLKNDEDITRQRLIRHEVLPADPLRQRRRKRYLVADKHLLALAQRYAAHYRGNDLLRYLRCVQHHLQKPRFPGEAADVNDDPLEDVVDDEVDGADDDDDDDHPEENGGHIPRRESHPGGRHGFEAAEDEQEEDGGQVVIGRGADAGDGGRYANRYAVNDPLPGFSQADNVARRQPVVQRGPVQLPSQSTNAPTTAGFVHHPAAAGALRRNPGRSAVLHGRVANGSF